MYVIIFIIYFIQEQINMDFGKYFSVDYDGPPFELFGSGHIATLITLLILIVYVVMIRNASQKVKDFTRYAIVFFMWGAEISWHLWNVFNHTWTVQTMLPLHMCSLMIWVAGFMMLTDDRRLFPFVYFLGVGGAIQAVLTPESGAYGFPHFRYLQTVTAHSFLILTGVFMTVVERLRPTWKDILKVLIYANVYMVIVFLINLMLGSNYLFINQKPATASVIDLLPAWPLYIPFLELIGLASFLILYFPFLVGDGFKKVFQKN